MTIVDFYKKLSRILTDTREEFLSRTEGQKRLEKLLEEAENNGLQVKVSENILDPINLMRLDDEKSFRSEDEDYYDDEFSYGGSSF
jgi:hypothetical protein